MKLFLIRHAECQQNVGQAANEDAENSSLTETGKTQVNRLALYFRDNLIHFTRVFSSDLDRAADTANVICEYQLGSSASRSRPIQTPKLREQQFGSSLVEMRKQSGSATSINVSESDGLELGDNPVFAEETLPELKRRARSFLDEYILPLLLDRPAVSNGNNDKKKGEKGGHEEEVVAVIAHGVILQILWICLTELFDTKDIHFGSGLGQIDYEDKVAPIWSNTGFTELGIEPLPPPPRPQLDSVGPTPATGGDDAAPALPTTPMGTAPPARPRRKPPATAKPTAPPLVGWSMTVLAIDSTAHLGTFHTGQAKGTGQNAMNGTRQEPTEGFYTIPGTA